MNKYILILALAIGLLGCNSEDVFPEGATYQTTTYEYFKGTGSWVALEWDNADFACIDNFVHDRVDTNIIPADVSGTDMTCDPSIEYRITVSKV